MVCAWLGLLEIERTAPHRWGFVPGTKFFASVFDAIGAQSDMRKTWQNRANDPGRPSSTGFAAMHDPSPSRNQGEIELCTKTKPPHVRRLNSN